MPQINKVYDFDMRNIKILEGNRTEKYLELLREQKDFVNFFETSPCYGKTNFIEILFKHRYFIGESNKAEKSVTFENLFNNQQCLPDCTTTTEIDDQNRERIYETCR